jgi:hypothetical protein
VTTKEVPLIGAGFHAFIDHLFWNLPFASFKQGNSLVKELDDLTEKNGASRVKRSGMSTSWIALPTIFA